MKHMDSMANGEEGEEGYRNRAEKNRQSLLVGRTRITQLMKIETKLLVIQIKRK